MIVMRATGIRFLLHSFDVPPYSDRGSLITI